MDCESNMRQRTTAESKQKFCFFLTKAYLKAGITDSGARDLEVARKTV